LKNKLKRKKEKGQVVDREPEKVFRGIKKRVHLGANSNMEKTMEISQCTRKEWKSRTFVSEKEEGKEEKKK